MDNIKQLEEVFQNRLNNHRLAIIRLKKGEDPYYIIPFFEYDYSTVALYEMYVKHDFKKARESFYGAARVAQYMSNTYDRRVMDSGLYQISYALFSDHDALINKYSILINTINHTTGIGYQLPNSVQNILLENWDKLDWNVRCIERLVKVAQFKYFAGVIDVLKGFKEKDEELIKKGLEGLIETHKKRNKDPLICKFFSIDTAGFNKLAWIKGYEINLNNPLVPQELMPIEPLGDYPEYDFMK